MNQYYKFNEDGYYVEPVIADFNYENPVPDDITDVRPPDGLYRARWTGAEWVETGEPPIQEPLKPTETQLMGQQITDLELATIEQGQQITELELLFLEVKNNV